MYFAEGSSRKPKCSVSFIKTLKGSLHVLQNDMLIHNSLLKERQISDTSFNADNTQLYLGLSSDLKVVVEVIFNQYLKVVM